MRSKIVAILFLVAGVGLGTSQLVQPAHAGTIILEGSDAIGFHSGFNTFAAAYRDQVWKAIGSTDARTIAVIGADPVTAGTIISTTHPITRFQTTGDAIAAGGLGSYVALYFLAGGGCCTEDDTLIDSAAEKAAVSAYLTTAGGTVMIENYVGGAEWDFAVHTGGAGNAHVAGFGGGLPGPDCDDGELVTTEGTMNGFTQPGAMGCWTHQGYDQSFFAPLGFTHNFFQSPPAYDAFNPTFPPGNFSSLLSSGVTVTVSDVPEPGTLFLLGTGLAGIAACAIARRRRQN